MSHPAIRVHKFPDATSLVTRVVEVIEANARAAIAERGRFLMVLAGGTTPEAVYERLRLISTDWAAWQLFMGDERCLPRGHPERNDTMARNVWIDHVPIPEAQVYAMPAELGADSAADVYAETLQGVGRFDLVLLGLGEDGHTASLFPGRDPGNQSDAPDVLAVHDAPKPPPDRVSLSAERLGRTRALLFLVMGAGKATAVSTLLSGGPVPAAAVMPSAGVDLFADHTALRKSVTAQ